MATRGNRFGALLAGLVFLAASAAVRAFPVTYAFEEDPRCDPHTITLTHELGETPPFPAGEKITGIATPSLVPLACPRPGGNEPLLTDFIITITNASGKAWVDLFFVADAGISVGNADGKINGGDAFKIDTVGVNKPLMSSSGKTDGVFEIDETLVFIVEDWSPTFPGAFPTPFASLEAGVDSTTGSSWASIVANPVSGPASLPLALLGLGVLACTRLRGAGRRPGRDGVSRAHGAE